MSENVRDNLAAGKYENKVPYSVVRVPVDKKTMTVKQARDHVLSEKVREQEQRRLHRKEDDCLTGILRFDLETENGLVGHQKAGKLWEIAWECGHSSGYLEIIGYYEKFAELLK